MVYFHHIYFMYDTVRHSNHSSMQDACPMNLVQDKTRQDKMIYLTQLSST